MPPYGGRCTFRADRSDCQENGDECPAHRQSSRSVHSFDVLFAFCIFPRSELSQTSPFHVENSQSNLRNRTQTVIPLRPYRSCIFLRRVFSGFGFPTYILQRSSPHLSCSDSAPPANKPDILQQVIACLCHRSRTAGCLNLNSSSSVGRCSHHLEVFRDACKSLVRERNAVLVPVIRLLIPSASATSCWVSFRFSRSALNFSPNVILVITPVHKKFATSNCASLLTKALEVRIIMTEQSNYS